MCTYYFKLMPLINIDAPDGNSAAPMMDYSIVLLRPKNEVKLSTQSAEKSICMGKRDVPNWGNLFLGLPKGPRRLDFSRESVRFQCPPWKNLSTNGRGGEDEKIIKTRIERSNFCRFSQIFADFRPFGPSF